jgi:hypothetical protein
MTGNPEVIGEESSKFRIVDHPGIARAIKSVEFQSVACDTAFLLP